jgi:type III secretion system low calcium response chaperone LcrH/SycD
MRDSTERFADEIAAFLEIPKEGSFSLEEEEQLYQAAYYLYERGDYPVAMQYFGKLVFANPLNETYWRGLASTQQMQKQYAAAADAWSAVALLADQDPAAPFHVAECLISLNEWDDALIALNRAESLLDENPPLRDKIILLRKAYHGRHPSKSA